MSRRSRWLAFLVLVGGVGAGVAALALLVKREPGFYADAPCPDEWDARERAARLVTRVQDLKNDIRTLKPEWGDTFTAEDLNGFFAENLGRSSGLRSVLPAGLHSPRVAIEGDRLKLGLRYGEGFWSTVVWVELKVWLVADEPNLVAVEVCDLRTGCMPVGAQSILDAVAEAARDKNVEVTWYRNGGNPVGLFRFYADQPQPASQILTLEVADGKVVVAGRSLPDRSAVAAAPPLGQ
ncbi:MAG: hypothetical protein K2X87_24295 [Gemmataceae bacterium]|nr:hypothetical protein [Gemmataceae bacterium]